MPRGDGANSFLYIRRGSLTGQGLDFMTPLLKQALG